MEVIKVVWFKRTNDGNETRRLSFGIPFGDDMIVASTMVEGIIRALRETKQKIDKIDFDEEEEMGHA